MKNGLKKRSNHTFQGIDHEFDILKKLYDLPTIFHRELVDRDFLKYVKQRHFFIIIAIFDLEGRILIIRDFGKSYGWELPGGSIDTTIVNDIHAAAQLTAKKTVGVNLYDIQPIALIKNYFNYQIEKVVTHHGLALIGRTNNSVRAGRDIEWGFFKGLPKTMFMANREIAKLAFEVLKQKRYQPATEEVIATELASWRHVAHQVIVNKTIGYRPSQQLRKAVIQAIGKGVQSIVDTSCGDDELALVVARVLQPMLVVCNDISTRHLSALKRKAHQSMFPTTIIFTNHDILDLPFNYIFDVSLSKNTLHHLRSDKDKQTLIKTLKRLAEKVVIIDIEDPTATSLKARLWNKYYVNFLKDQGHYFLTWKKLDQILSACCQKNEYRIKRISTFRGNYLMAIIEPTIA